MSLDHRPYIGVHRRSRPNHYVATGFSKWGMTGSYVAARTITDLIVKGRSSVQGLFSPQRSMLHASLFSNLGTSTANLVKPGRRCSHLGCCLAHNDVEDSWDCPCHGAGRAGNEADLGVKAAAAPPIPRRTCYTKRTSVLVR